MFNKLKQYLPGSARSLHAMYREVLGLREDVATLQNQVTDMSDRLYNRIETADFGINGNIDFKFDERTIPMISQLSSDVSAHDEHMKMFAWESYRKENESLDEAKIRFFKEMPKAKGGLRLLQLGCSKLLGEFDSLCKEHNIDYWINFGTLIGAIRHEGFIPWDDDTDLGIMREDLDRLIEIVNKDDRYKITIVFDHYVHSRQIRFLYNNEDLPCFLDLFIYDWAPSTSNDLIEQQRVFRNAMENKMEKDDKLAFWQTDPYYHGDKDDYLQSYFDETLNQVKETGIICEKAAARAVIWSVDNIDDHKQKRMVFDINDVFPTQRMKFENSLLRAPKTPDAFLKYLYGDIYELPKDIHSHFEHVNHEELESDTFKSAIDNL